MDKLEITFENANKDQAHFLTQLALDSNAYYKYRTVSDQEAIKVFRVNDEHINNGIIRVMKNHSEIIGFYGLISEEKGGKTVNIISHFFLKPDFIGKGYGKKLFQEMIRTASEELNWDGLMWESDPNAAWFYRKMGAKKIGEIPCPLKPPGKAPVFIYIIPK